MRQRNSEDAGPSGRRETIMSPRQRSTTVVRPVKSPITATAGGDDVIVISSQQTASPSPRARRQQKRYADNTATGRTGENNVVGTAEVVDLTEEPDFEVISSTVVRRSPRKIVVVKSKRPKPDTTAATETLRRLQAEPDEPKNPVCGICFEGMGKNTNKQMAAGNCGHVYCKQCLMYAVKTRKKCPTCSAKMQPKQIRNIFFDLN